MSEKSGQVHEGTLLSRGDSAKIRRIVERSRSIKTTKVAAEVLDWLIANVDGYIDSEATIYRIYFKPETFSAQTETGRLQKLYAGIPDTGAAEEAHCLKTLQNVILCVKLAMDADVERLGKLFECLMFSCEMKRAHGTGERVRFGRVIIHDFIFDIVSSTARQCGENAQVARQQKQRRSADERILCAASDESVVEQQLPSGFSVEMEVAWWRENTAEGP